MSVTKQAEREVVLAVLELDDLRTNLRQRRRGYSFDEGIVETLDHVVARLSRSAPTDGIPVAAAAQYLGVSAPTIRAWMRHGLLQRVPEARPAKIEASSLHRVRAALNDLRTRGQERDWLHGLSDYLHDHADRRSPSVRKGIEELGRGELEPA